MAMDSTIDLLVGLGDYQYGCSDPAEWAASYNPTWGFFNNIIDPSVGNHEYNTTTNSANGTPCPDANLAANDYFNYFGAVAHPGTAGEYSYNVGKWHLISLNANCANQGVGGCSASSPQTQWLSADLAANTQPCVMAYWHQPLWTATANNQKSTPAVVEPALPVPHGRRAERPHPHVRPIRVSEPDAARSTTRTAFVRSSSARAASRCSSRRRTRIRSRS